MQKINLLLAGKTDCRTLGTDRWNEQPRGSTVQPVFRSRSASMLKLRETCVES